MIAAFRKYRSRFPTIILTLYLHLGKDFFRFPIYFGYLHINRMSFLCISTLVVMFFTKTARSFYHFHLKKSENSYCNQKNGCLPFRGKASISFDANGCVFLRQIPLRNPLFRVENLSVLRTAVSGQRLAFRQRFIVVPRAVRQIIAVAVDARNALLRRETQLVKSRGGAAQRIERERRQVVCADFHAGLFRSLHQCRNSPR